MYPVNQFRRLFVIANGESGGWTDSTHTEFIVEMDSSGMISASNVGGRNMFEDEVASAVGRFIREYEKQYGALPVFHRQNTYRFASKSGSSGCHTYYIEVLRRYGFPERKRLLEISCTGKTPGFRCFVGDLLDLYRSMQVIVKVEDGAYHYDPDLDFKRELEMKIISPRYHELEEGWNSPDSKEIKECVPLNTVRTLMSEVRVQTVVNAARAEMETRLGDKIPDDEPEFDMPDKVRYVEWKPLTILPDWWPGHSQEEPLRPLVAAAELTVYYDVNGELDHEVRTIGVKMPIVRKAMSKRFGVPDRLLYVHFPAPSYLRGGAALGLSEAEDPQKAFDALVQSGGYAGWTEDGEAILYSEIGYLRVGDEKYVVRKDHKLVADDDLPDYYFE